MSIHAMIKITTIEYILIDGINDEMAHAEELAIIEVMMFLLMPLKDQII